MIKSKLSYIATIFLLTSMLISCMGKSPFFEENKTLANNTWELTDTARFSFEIEDTNQLYDFYFNLRNLSTYSYSNIFIDYKLKFPNGKSLTDTAEFILAKPNGRWLGKTISGSIIDNSMLFSRKKRFPLKGTYEFAVIHGMRQKNLDHIANIGFKILETSE